MILAFRRDVEGAVAPSHAQSRPHLLFKHGTATVERVGSGGRDHRDIVGVCLGIRLQDPEAVPVRAMQDDDNDDDYAHDDQGAAAPKLIPAPPQTPPPPPLSPPPGLFDAATSSDGTSTGDAHAPPVAEQPESKPEKKIQRGGWMVKCQMLAEKVLEGKQDEALALAECFQRHMKLQKEASVAPQKEASLEPL